MLSRKASLGAALALAAPLILVGPVAVSQAQLQEPCAVAGPTQSPSDVIAGGTKIEFTLSCASRPQTRTIGTTVSLDLDGQPQVVFAERDTFSSGGSSGEAKKSIHLPTPPHPGLSVCIDVDGQKIPPGCTPAA